MTTPHADHARDPFAPTDELPEALPDHPWGIFREWWDMAHTRGDLAGGSRGDPVQPNPNCFTVATLGTGPDGSPRPAARVVLCKGMDLDAGYLVFYTNYQGRKGRELGEHPRAAAVFYWDTLDRQIRVEGPIVASPPEEGDAYFQSRRLESRIGAWASKQSEPLPSRDHLMADVLETMARFEVSPEQIAGTKEEQQAVHVPRPPHWGGYRLWAERVELWINSSARVHDRAEWTRELTPNGAGFDTGPWTSTRLYP